MPFALAHYVGCITWLALMGRGLTIRGHMLASTIMPECNEINIG